MKKILSKDRGLAFPRYKNKTKPQIRGILDRWFAKYIKLRDCATIKGEDRYGKCSTCGRIKTMYGNDCGHFAIRKHDSTRWDEMNSHFQCHWCNGRMKGRQADMGFYINRKYGKGTAETLIKKSKINRRFEKFELVAMIDFYKKKVKQLERS